MSNIFLQTGKLPFFSKNTLRLTTSLKREALDMRIKRALKKEQILGLKKGLYVTKEYYQLEPDKTTYREFISSVIREPSYLSLEYVLSKYNLLTEATFPITCVTVKSSRDYENFLGDYRYLSIKQELFFGFQKKSYKTNIYYEASLAKALFDYLYLKKNISTDITYEIKEGLRLNWENFTKEDLNEFKKIVSISKSAKMNKYLKIINKYYG